ncbi:hypothetical protein SGA02_24550 [Staphylococcus gallinarum]|uniref:Uncharacterized protein n=1 Tax=Staphylococcus gallinarum TaxID=1293 RepID=A0ABQ0Y5E6_STAGA|nr:hypothetical protein SGA02_24550 [Staphylococcus gallinarum]
MIKKSKLSKVFSNGNLINVLGPTNLGDIDEFFGLNIYITPRIISFNVLISKYCTCTFEKTVKDSAFI